MEQISTEHRGHKIVYSDNAEHWWCGDWDYSNVSLAKVRAKIDAEYLKIRKSASLDCFEFASEYNYSPDVIPSKIIEYIGEKFEREWRTNAPKFVGHQVAAVAVRRANEKASRSTKVLSQFVPDTEDAHKAIAEAKRMHSLAKEAAERAKEAFNAIPRVTIEMINDLVRVAKNSSDGSGES